MWDQHKSWNDAEKAWETGASSARKEHPLKILTSIPDMVGITPDTAKNLKWKSFKWMIGKDEGFRCIKHFFKHPLRYSLNYLKSIFKKKSYARDGDFFLYGVNSLEAFQRDLDDEKALLVVGFSYCHKPFECPSGRFTPDCEANPDNSVCRQCFIGKVMNALPQKNVIRLVIPTVHYIGEQMFSIVHQYPHKKVLFLITACEMTLEMFGDWGNMIGTKGIGVRLGGRICNTMKAFELSENGIKPGLTLVLKETEERIFQMILALRNSRHFC